MPWKIESKHAGCPPAKPYGVVKQSDGKLEGCHATRGEAEDHMRALYANAPEEADTMTDTMLGGKPSKGTAADRRLGENKTRRPRGMAKDVGQAADAETAFGDQPVPKAPGQDCPDGFTPSEDGKMCMPDTSASTVVEAFVTDAPWDGAASRFSDDQYQSAAAACGPASEGTVKERCFLPHHEPGGELNVNGMHNAAARIATLKNRPADAIARAKAHLRGHYNEQKDQIPDSIKAEIEQALVLTAEERATLSVEELAVFEQQVAPAAMGPHWRGVMVVEGVPTGDRREFALDSLNWPDPAGTTLALQWQKESSHGGEHDVTVAVGRIDRVWREPTTVERDGEKINANLIWGEGRFDVHTDATEAQRRMGSEMLNGCSIAGDDITQADIEYVWPRDEMEIEDSAGEGEEGEADIIQLLFGQPDKVIYHSARLRAVTLCDIPAYVEATLHTVTDHEPSLDDMIASMAARLADLTPRAAVAPHPAEISLAEWDGAAHETRMRMRLPRAVAAAAFAYVEPGAGDVDRTACRFLHHETDAEGNPGPANLSACLSLIQAVHTAQLPDPEKAGIYRHLAAHLTDAGHEAPPYEPQHALLAHAWQEQEYQRHADWFTDPEIKHPTPILVTDAGQVYGLASEWHECHIGITGECVLPPREAYHERFMTGVIPLDNGQKIPVGQITAGIGHAPTGISVHRVAEHYDNTEAVVADVIVGNCKAGIWVAGEVRPWAQAQRVDALRASGEVSPDWRRIGGQLKLVALLTVNASGYQVPRVRTLVAGGQIQTMIASGMVSVHVGQAAQPSDDAEQARLDAEMTRLREQVEANGRRTAN